MEKADKTPPDWLIKSDGDLYNNFRLLFDNSPSGIAIYKVINDGKSGSDYIIQDFNRTALEYEKLASNDLKGKSLKDIRPAVDEYGLVNVFRKVWKTGKSKTYPVKKYIDSNFSNYFENTVFRISNDLIVAVFNDVTVRENSIEKLKESELRFNRAMDATRDGLFDWNLATNEIYYSPGWKKMLGYKNDELPNDFSVWENLTEKKDVEKSWKIQQELINRKRDRFVSEFKMRHKDGHWVDILARANAYFDENDKAVRIVGTHTDISLLKKYEKEIIRKNKALEKEISERNKAEKIAEKKDTLLNQTGHLAGIAGWESDLEQKKIIWTDSIKDILGIIPSSQVSIADTLDYYNNEDMIGFKNIYRKSIENGDNFDLLLQIYSSDKKLKWVRIYGEPVVKNGKCIIVRGALQDVTIQKNNELRLEESYRQLRELSHHLQNAREDQNKYIAREIHDDLGQSLTCLEMLLTLFEEEISKKNISDKDIIDLTREFREQIDSSVEKTRKLTHNLRPSILDSSDFLNSLNLLIKNFTIQSHAEVVSNIQIKNISLKEEKKLAVYRIFQEALTNILRHAQTSKVEIDFYEKDDNLVIIVKDYGKGFSVSSNKNKGFGLLNIHERAIYCNGSIEIISSANTGTTVKAVIPIKGNE